MSRTTTRHPRLPARLLKTSRHVVGSGLAWVSVFLPTPPVATRSRSAVIGCGGRGTGASTTCSAQPKASLVAVGDFFKDRLAIDEEPGQARAISRRARRSAVRRMGRLPEGHRQRRQLHHPAPRRPPADVPEGRDCVGKNVFTEKPVAGTQPASSGLRAGGPGQEQVPCRRGHAAASSRGVSRDAQAREIRAIGDVSRCACSGTGGLGQASPADDRHGWQLRNWLYFTWLSAPTRRQHVTTSTWPLGMGDKVPVRSSASEAVRPALHW